MSDSPAAAACAIPITFDQAMSPQWLTDALATLTGGARITGVEVVEVIKVMATKIRFVARWNGGSASLCLKAFLDLDAQTARGGIVSITEADFYTEIAPRLSVRVPACVATFTDRAAERGVIIMRDLTAGGAHFCTALEPFSVDAAASSLSQLARLHAGAALLEGAPWLGERIADLAHGDYIPTALLQEHLDGARGEGLASQVRNAAWLKSGLKALARRNAFETQTLIHGDCHAGNIFQTKEGPGLIDWQLFQRGNWALDVAYHICAVLSVELAEREEWALLDHYLQEARSVGVELPSLEVARANYRTSVVYGYYLWAITRRVDPHIINVFVHRLGSAVARHDSYRQLGM